MSDLIDRQNALDEILRVYEYEFPTASGAFDEFVTMIIPNILQNLPSVDTKQTAKVIEHDASVTDTDGYKYHRSEYLCGACKKRVLGGDDYCSHCGAKLIWGENDE